MVYVIRTRGSNPEFLKIGFSKSATRERLRKMQTGCPFNLELISVTKGTVKEEKALQKKLQKFHFRGEWFYCNKESLKALGLSENSEPIKLSPDEVAPGVSFHDWYKEEKGFIHPSLIKERSLTLIS